MPENTIAFDEFVSTQVLEPWKGIKKVAREEYFTSGHRTCQGCESALLMKLMAKAAGPRSIILGANRLHVRGQHHVLLHAVGGALDAHAARIRGLRCHRHGRRSEGNDAQG